MFDVIEEDEFIEAVYDCFSVLDKRYVADQSHELLARLKATFEAMYETSFIVLDTKTGKPVNIHAVLNSWDAAQNMRKVIGEEGHEVGFLLRIQ